MTKSYNKPLWVLQSVRFILVCVKRVIKNMSDITKCNIYHKISQKNYYQMHQLSQSVTVITIVTKESYKRDFQVLTHRHLPKKRCKCQLSTSNQKKN